MPVNNHYLENEQQNILCEHLQQNEDALILYDILDKETLQAITKMRFTYSRQSVPHQHNYEASDTAQDNLPLLKTSGISQFLNALNLTITSLTFMRFSHRDYTLIESTHKKEIRLFIDITPTWNESWGASVHHAGVSGSTLIPLRYGAAALIVSSKLTPFVKYVNHHAGPHARTFLAITAAHTEHAHEKNSSL